MLRNILFVGLSFIAGAVEAETRTAVLCDGTTFAAAVTVINETGEITLTSGGKTRNVLMAELVRWGSPAEIVGPVVVLADDTILTTDRMPSDRDKRTRAMVFHLPSDLRQRDALLDRAVQGDDNTDRLLLLNGDELTGSVESINTEKVHVQTELGSMNIEIDRLSAVMLRSPSNDVQGLYIWAGLRDGSRLPAVKIVLDAKSLAITLASGTTIRALPNDLVWLQPMDGRAVYLSDLKPADYQHTPFLSLTWPYRLDRSVRDRWLRCGQQTYFKGLGMHSGSRLSYLLTEPYRYFEADVGIDDETTGGGSVRFRVFVDGQQKYVSPIVRGGQRPLPVHVDLTGAKRIDLVVDYVDWANVLDHADWLDARLIH